jgi:basic membrane protein A
MSRRFFSLFCALVLIATAASLSGCAASGEEEASVKIGFVFLEGVDGHGWSERANLGRLAIEDEFPEVDTVFVDNVPISEDATRTMEQLIDDGCTMIFVTSSFADFTTKVATDHPDIKFVAFGLGEMQDNVRYYIMDIWNPGYLIGMAAGLLSETGKLGYLQGFPGYYSDVNAFTFGAQSINPDITTKVVFVGSYADPVAEKQLSTALIDDGVDFLYGMTRSINFLEVAENRDVWGAGLYVDERPIAPTSYVTSMMLYMEPYFTDQVAKFLDGTWEGGTFDIVPYGDMTALGEWGDSVPQEVRDEVDAMSQRIMDGYNPFIGPIYDAEGTLRVEEGQAITFQDFLFGEPWPIQGLIVSP